jgi:hypothetical protein
MLKQAKRVIVVAPSETFRKTDPPTHAAKSHGNITAPFQKYNDPDTT